MGNKIVIEKMLFIINRLEGFLNHCDYNTFKENDMMIDACVFNLSQLGEQVANIDGEFEKKHPDIPWREIYGLRNRIVHDYEGINLNLIWEIITEDLPDLKEKLQKL